MRHTRREKKVIDAAVALYLMTWEVATATPGDVERAEEELSRVTEDLLVARRRKRK